MKLGHEIRYCLTHNRILNSEDDYKTCLSFCKIRKLKIIKVRDNIFETGEMSKEDRTKLTIKFDILDDELE